MTTRHQVSPDTESSSYRILKGQTPNMNRKSHVFLLRYQFLRLLHCCSPQSMSIVLGMQGPWSTNGGQTDLTQSSSSQQRRCLKGISCSSSAETSRETAEGRAGTNGDGHWTSGNGHDEYIEASSDDDSSIESCLARLEDSLDSSEKGLWAVLRCVA